MMQPVRTPLYHRRHYGNVLIDLSRRAGKTLAYDEFKKYVMARWEKENAGALTDILTKGGYFCDQVCPKEKQPKLIFPSNPLPAIKGKLLHQTGQATLIVSQSSSLSDWKPEKPANAQFKSS